jgi:hypothetical protein
MVMMRKTLEKVEIPPAATPAEFPPPIFAAAASVFVFRSSAVVSSRELFGAIYIVIFRLKYIGGEKIT